MSDVSETSREAIPEGREHIAKLADADGETQFAREVRAGCWDHRNDVSAAIARAASLPSPTHPNRSGA